MNNPRSKGKSPILSTAKRKHIAYVLLAEFDIDEGSVLRYEYPNTTGTDSHLLAELMLPDGAHLRAEDWTVFYLPTDSLNSSLEATQEVLQSPVNEIYPQGGQNRLLYVLNLASVSYRQAKSARGAMVKSLAVCSYEPYIQIYKPLLLLALENYFNDPSVSCLARLYTAINAMDTSLAPNFSRSERLVLRASERKDLFEERFAPSEQSPEAIGTNGIHSTADDWTSDAQSVHSTSYSSRKGSVGSQDELRKDRSRSRAGSTSDGRENTSNASLPALARQVSTSQISTSLSLDNSRASTPANAMNGNAIRRPKDTHYYDTKIAFSNVSVPIRLPLTTFPEEVGDYSLIRLIQLFSSPSALPASGPLYAHLHTQGHSTHPIIFLFNALITGMRIVFLGNGQPAGEVANLVLAACALASGCGSVLRGFTERAFPYSNLTNIDNHEKVDGYIAGVTNPRFEDLTSRWDILCNIENGKISISKDLRVPQSRALLRPFTLSNSIGTPNQDGSITPLSTISNSHLTLASANSNLSVYPSNLSSATSSSAVLSGGSDSDIGRAPLPPLTHTNSSASLTSSKIDAKYEAYDNTFMEDIMMAIQAHLGEATIRARFTDYLIRFIQLASKHEYDTFGSGIVFIDEISKSREMSINLPRIESWRSNKSYNLFCQDFQEIQEHSVIRGIDLVHQINKLRLTRKMSTNESELIYRTISLNIKDSDQIVELLSNLPSHLGGILPLSFGLFHPLASTRNAVIDLFTTLNSDSNGNKFLKSLNSFHRLAFYRLNQDHANHTPPNSSLRSTTVSPPNGY